MAKILIVEDDVNLAQGIQSVLEFERHTVDVAHHGEYAIEMLAATSYDLLILDWELPGISGLEICKQSAGLRQTAILMLTGRDGIEDTQCGLDSGADDYMTKPFNIKELTARVRALLRRLSKTPATSLQAGPVMLDPLDCTATVYDRRVQLTGKEFAVLELLVRHPGQVFSTEAMIERVWSVDSERSADSVRTLIKKLRQKLGDSQGEPLLKNVHGLGYKLEIPENSSTASTNEKQ